MAAKPTAVPALSDQERRDYRQAQEEHDELMAQIADREAQVETGLIDSYSDYTFAWEYEVGSE